VPDENDIDAGWDSEPDPEPEPERPEPTPTPDIEALDGGWDAPRRHRTGAERAASRKEKARARAQRQKDRAADAARKQKQKQKRSGPPARASDAERKPMEKPTVGAAALAFSPRRTKRSWVRMLVAVALIVAIAAFVLFVIER
jgi:hypothetical protein